MRRELKEKLKELVQNDPYIAFFIEFLADLGIEALLGNAIKNPKTGTKISANPILNNHITIEQNGKNLTLPIHTAKRLIEEMYGRIPLVLF